MRNNELTEVQKLQEDIMKEKFDKKQKRLTELEAAQRVIKENEKERMIRLAEKEQQKMDQNRLTEEYNLMLDKQEKLRSA